jgi:hypothetical protein
MVGDWYHREAEDVQASFVTHDSWGREVGYHTQLNKLYLRKSSRFLIYSSSTEEGPIIALWLCHPVLLIVLWLQDRELCKDMRDPE